MLLLSSTQNQVVTLPADRKMNSVFHIKRQLIATPILSVTRSTQFAGLPTDSTLHYNRLI